MGQQDSREERAEPPRRRAARVLERDEIEAAVALLDLRGARDDARGPVPRRGREGSVGREAQRDHDSGPHDDFGAS